MINRASRREPLQSLPQSQELSLQARAKLLFVDDQEFLLRADEALHDLNRRLAVASDQFTFESDLSSGALVIEFEDTPVKFVVSPNSPVRQIWLSALSKSFKLDWDATRNEFVLSSSGQSLADLVSGCLSQQLKETVQL